MLHTDLLVWKKSMELVNNIYKLTSQLPTTEKYGLSSQINRAAISIPVNIAEGVSRTSTKEYIRFLDIAHSSAVELETLLLILSNLNFAYTQDIIANQIIPIKKMLFKLKESLKRKLL